MVIQLKTWLIKTTNIEKLRESTNVVYESEYTDLAGVETDLTEDEIMQIDGVTYVTESRSGGLCGEMKMKKVKVTYFKPSEKYYTSEVVEISSELNGYEAMFKELPKHHRIKSMFMLIQNNEPDGEEIEPYIVPHLFHPKESWK